MPDNVSPRPWRWDDENGAVWDVDERCLHFPGDRTMNHNNMGHAIACVNALHAAGITRPEKLLALVAAAERIRLNEGEGADEYDEYPVEVSLGHMRDLTDALAACRGDEERGDAR